MSILVTARVDGIRKCDRTFTAAGISSIIDIKETVRGILRAQRYLQKVSAAGSLILFVGTKRQAAEPIQEAAEAAGMPYVCERWLGGTLTNFRTVRSRLKRLDELESGEMASYSKKRQSTLKREHKKIRRNLEGIRHMNRMPEAVVVIDPKNEKNCVHECRLLGIKVVGLIDTDSDPDTIDLPIPGNDDSIRSIRLVLNLLAAAVKSAQAPAARTEKAEVEPELKAVPNVS